MPPLPQARQQGSPPSLLRASRTRTRSRLALEITPEEPFEIKLTQPQIMERIYSEIRAAALEDVEYDPYKVAPSDEVTFKKTAAAQDDSPSDAEPVRLSRPGLRKRASSYLTDILLPKESRRSFSVSPRRKSDTAETPVDPLLRLSDLNLSPLAPPPPLRLDSSSPEKYPSYLRRVPSFPDSLRSSLHYASSTKAAASSSSLDPFYAHSLRDALLEESPTDLSCSIGTESILSTSAPASAIFTPNDSTASIGSARPAPKLSSVVVMGGPSKIRARTLLGDASKAIREERLGRNNARNRRLRKFVKEHGRMLLSVCAHSETFHQLLDSDEASWTSIYDLIGENITSVELYAAHSQLDWSFPLPPGTLPKCREKLVYLNPGSRQVISLAGHFYTPVYKTLKQVEIGESFYNFGRWTDHGPPGITRMPVDGDCALCGNPDFCSCEPPNDHRALIELREYPDLRGIGVRTLRSIQRGEIIGTYFGEMRPTMRSEDSSYILEHLQPSDDTKTICFLDATERGNWTRFLRPSRRPGVSFVSAPVGKKRCVLVRAIRDIAMFEEITVDSGADNLEDGDREHSHEEWASSSASNRKGKQCVKDESSEDAADKIDLERRRTVIRVGRARSGQNKGKSD